MGRHYLFYPAWKNENGKIEALLWDNNCKPALIFARSESFIDSAKFKDLRMISPEEFDINCEKFFAHRYDSIFTNNANNLTYVYECPQEWINSMGQSHGLVEGYVPIDDFATYYNDEDQQEYYYWNMDKPLSANIIAELPEDKRNDYIKFAHIDTYSAEYICNILAEILNSIYVPYDKKGEKIILMVYSF